MQSNSDVSIQAELKNLIFHSTMLDDRIFNVEIQAQEKAFTRDEDNQELNSLKSTVILDEMYSLNVSQFLGKTEALLEKEE